MNETGDQDREHALVRAAIYRFLAEVFHYPWPGTLRRLKDRIPPAAVFEAWGDAAASAAAPLEEIRGRLGVLSDATLESEHLRSFGHTVPEAYPPVETRFGSAHPFQETQELADIAAFYDVFGLRVREGTGERVDHIALEIEFLYLLALKETFARERGNAEGAARCLEATKSFFADHPGRWGPVFGDLVAKKAPSPLTRAFGALLAAVLRADARLLEIEPRPVSPEPIPVPPEPEAVSIEDDGS